MSGTGGKEVGTLPGSSIAMYDLTNIPDQTGRNIVITGANTGIGFASAQALAVRGARVTLCCRSVMRGQAAVRKIQQIKPDADLSVIQLDLANLESVKKASSELLKLNRLDVLINNAGVMLPPREPTIDGFEKHFGVNHLGHFALTCHLLPVLTATRAARVVSVSSVAHKFGSIDFSDPHAVHHYHGLKRYAASKLANLLFTFELQRLFESRGDSNFAVACHPGIAETELSRYFPKWIMKTAPLLRGLFNNPEEGALPVLRAAVDAVISGGEYFGPTKRFETARSAGLVCPSARALDAHSARRLWLLSAELTQTGLVLSE